MPLPSDNPHEIPPDTAFALLNFGFDSNDPIKALNYLLNEYNTLQREFSNYKAMYGPGTPRWVTGKRKPK